MGTVADPTPVARCKKEDRTLTIPESQRPWVADEHIAKEVAERVPPPRSTRPPIPARRPPITARPALVRRETAARAPM